MSRRRNSSNALVELVAALLYVVIVLIIKIITLIYDVVTFHTSGYKVKSGNSFLKMYFNKGFFGEFILYRKVVKRLGKKNVFTNLYLDNKKTDTTEIDVVGLSSKGIYVFEMKNYAGYIYGSDKDEYWTQAFTRFNKHKFYNPLKQNYAHTKAIESYLNVEGDKIIPMVVFSKRSKLKKLKLSHDQIVLHLDKALIKLKKYEKKNKDIIDNSQLREYETLLIQRSNMSEEVKQKHIEDVMSLK